MNPDLHIGTCSWKYDSWRGLVYSDTPGINYLAEYSRKYDTVEIDQWFWSLHGPDKVTLPQPRDVEAYAASVPAQFRFGIKMPNALTMTHYGRKEKTAPLVPNPHFLSVDLLERFMERLEPMRGLFGPLMFQFGYLNKQMMPSQAAFLDKLSGFVGRLPSGCAWCIECRNPNYLNDRYFQFLQSHGLGHVWLQGYYMPSIFDLYSKYADAFTSDTVIRLHGPDREGMDERAGSDWSKLIEPRDGDLAALAVMLRDLGVKRRRTWVYANNHFEGSAPHTLERLQKLLI